MRYLPFLLLLLSAIAGYSQTTVVDVNKDDVNVTTTMFYTVGGSPVSSTKYVKVVSGTPYFEDVWMKGRLTLQNGTVYDSLMLKLDMVDNTLLYIGANGETMTATSLIKDATLINSAGKEYHFIHSSFMGGPSTMQRGWYQALTTGHATLYKYFSKNLIENKPYGSATVEQSIVTVEKFLILNNSVFTWVKKWKELPDLLSDKKNELNAFINSKKLSGKSEADYTELITYYNSLFQKQ
jgi:hypothetical protein